MELLASAGFWIELVEIIRFNITSSGDNAVVIASEVRSLPLEQHWLAVF